MKICLQNLVGDKDIITYLSESIQVSDVTK